MSNGIPEYPVRIFAEYDDGEYDDGEERYYEDLRDEYDASDFAVLPAVGDVIVSPWANSKDRWEPQNRTFYEVVRRYFSPSSSKPDWVVLVVKPRAGTERERGVFNK